MTMPAPAKAAPRRTNLFSRPMLAKGAPSQVAAPLEQLALDEPLILEWPQGVLSAGSGLPSSCEPLSSMLAHGMSLRLLGEMPRDREQLFNHWMALGPEGLRTRFFHPPSAELLERRARDLSFDNPRIVGIFDEDGFLACAGEWAHEPGVEGEAEAAFSTVPRHQRRGLGKIIAAACVLDARERGALILRVDTLRHNIAAQALAASLGGRRPRSVASWEDCVSSRISLAEATPEAVMARLKLPAPAKKPPQSS